MTHVNRLIVFLATGVVSVVAQNQFKPYYHITRTYTISGTAPVLSIQNPRADGQQANITGMFVACSAACEWQVEMDGTTAAGGTDVSAQIAKGTKRLITSQMKAYDPSPSSTPRFVIPYRLLSAGMLPVMFTGYSLPSTNSTDTVLSNFTVRFLTTTGVTATVFVQWEEP